MKNFWSKWFVSTSSGILGRMLLVVLCLGAGFVGGQYISIPIDKEIITGAGVFIDIIALLIFPFFSSLASYDIGMVYSEERF